MAKVRSPSTKRKASPSPSTKPKAKREASPSPSTTPSTVPPLPGAPYGPDMERGMEAEVLGDLLRLHPRCSALPGSTAWFWERHPSMTPERVSDHELEQARELAGWIVQLLVFAGDNERAKLARVHNIIRGHEDRHDRIAACIGAIERGIAVARDDLASTERKARASATVIRLLAYHDPAFEVLNPATVQRDLTNTLPRESTRKGGSGRRGAVRLLADWCLLAGAFEVKRKPQDESDAATVARVKLALTNALARSKGRSQGV